MTIELGLDHVINFRSMEGGRTRDRDYPRDLIGYGRKLPAVVWPGGARVAVQFVINYEEGSENCVLHGDQGSETFLSEIVGAEAFRGLRHLSMESIYEYGARAGFWRLWRIFKERVMPVKCLEWPKPWPAIPRWSGP